MQMKTALCFMNLLSYLGLRLVKGKDLNITMIWFIVRTECSQQFSFLKEIKIKQN